MPDYLVKRKHKKDTPVIFRAKNVKELSTFLSSGRRKLKGVSVKTLHNKLSKADKITQKDYIIEKIPTTKPDGLEKMYHDKKDIIKELKNAKEDITYSKNLIPIKEGKEFIQNAYMSEFTIKPHLVLTMDTADDIKKFVLDKVRELGRNHNINYNYQIVYTIYQGEEEESYEVYTRYVNMNRLDDVHEDLLSKMMSDYEAKDIEKITVRYVKRTDLSERIVYGNHDDELFNNMVKKIMNERKPKTIKNMSELLSGKRIISPKTIKNCFIHACFIANNYERPTNDDVKNFIKKYNLKDVDRTPKNLCESISKHFKVDIQVYDIIDFELKYTYDDENYGDMIQVLICGSHTYAIVDLSYNDNDNLEVEYENIYYEEELIETPKYKDKNDDYKLCTWDIETYDKKKKGKKNAECYGCGFYDGEKYKEFYKQKTEDRPLKDFMTYIRGLKEDIIIYSHNGGKFDIWDVMPYITKNDYITITDILIINGRIINLNLLSFVDGDTNHIIFRDSYTFITSTLDKACGDFKTKIKKLDGKVDHNLINADNCYTKWCYDYTAKYLKNDVLSLHEIMTTFENIIQEAYGFSIKNVLTNAGIARRVYLQRYNEYELYSLSEKNDDLFRPFYFGGRNECIYKMGVINGRLYYLDFTSLYPYVMGKNKYGVGRLIEKKIDAFMPNKLGFYEVEIKHKSSTIKKGKELPYIAVNDKGKLVFSYLKDYRRMILTSHEIKYIIENNLGYRIKYLRVFYYEKDDYVFTSVVNDLYTMKIDAEKDGNDALRAISKVIINSLYGFWGIKLKGRDQFKIIKNKNEKEDKRLFDKYVGTETLTDYKRTDKYSFFRYEGNIKCVSNLGIAMLTTAYARTELYDVIRYIRNKGFNVYYCDTDSIITDFNPYKDDVFYNKHMNNDGALGQLTNETGRSDESGYYKKLISLGCKQYALHNEDIKTEKKDKSLVLKFKGVNIKDTYKKKRYDEENKIIRLKGLDRINGKEKVSLKDYELMAEGWTIVADNLTFISSVKIFTDDHKLHKLVNKKHVCMDYTKGIVNEFLISPMII